ncbi:OsmC family protein [Octadecabacter sp. SW4]|uniref:bifunctional alpha/beta hydrolase/OsmC family protein n=1 Tax=Octadecabacter sp. SW4 TaxID=2602067 RepID=UPI0011C1D54C|nr:bifunctional alpha/beta hydrolase/OsmC family protein [Octadecabacter sp. SW4]QEE35921.1 OsmC family protein [Octadecabacter sp. SW4]
MPTERLTFQGHSGHTLAARLDLPEGPHLATALFAHCFTCSKDIPAARRISGRLAAMGIAVLRFDFTGLGHSKGEFSNTNFTTNVQDIMAACAALDERGMAPGLLIGHSLGGAAVLKAAPDMAGIKAVVTIGAPDDPAHVTHNFADALPEIMTHGVAQVSLGGRPFKIDQQFIDDVSKGELLPAISKLKAALLILHSPIDDTVGIENASEIFLAARHPKSFVTLDDADHLITNPEDAEYAAEVIASWSQRYLDLKAPAPPIGAPEGVLRISEADPDGFLQDVQNGPHHHMLADEPLAYGGTNRGMSPYGFLGAGLGACTSMTIRMYARRKGWPLTHVSVDVTHDKVHAQDAAAQTGTKVDNFARLITLTGDLSEMQRQKLLEIASKCPVHRTLERRSHITTELAP